VICVDLTGSHHAVGFSRKWQVVLQEVPPCIVWCPFGNDAACPNVAARVNQYGLKGEQHCVQSWTPVKVKFVTSRSDCWGSGDAYLPWWHLF
jgi:hypothetical protein